jgi:hypothetical protein
VWALRRVAARAVRGGHHAAWALEAFDGDEELAAAALMDEARVAWAAASAARVAEPWRSHWEAARAARARLLALRPAAPTMPRDITAWACARLELEVDRSEGAALARKVGTRAHVMIAAPQPTMPPQEVADRLALAVGAFPLGDHWRPATIGQATDDLAWAIGHDLAYRTERRSAASATARAARFLAAAGAGATALSGLGATASTFDRAFAVVGPERAGIAIFTGED